MIWVIFLSLGLIFSVLLLVQKPSISWVNQLLRLPTQADRTVDNSMPSAKDNYLAAMNWLSDSILLDWTLQWTLAPSYLSGLFLRRYLEVLKQYYMGQTPRYLGVLRCAHQIEIKELSNGRCLVVDSQTSRRMATYEYWTQQRQGTQDLGDGVLVYEMKYDKHAQRWKIHRFVQELPIGWQAGDAFHHKHLTFKLRNTLGRDS